jgi:hypothetical protein
MPLSPSSILILIIASFVPDSTHTRRPRLVNPLAPRLVTPPASSVIPRSSSPPEHVVLVIEITSS